MEHTNINLNPEVLSLIKLAKQNNISKTEFKKFILEKQRKLKEKEDFIS